MKKILLYMWQLPQNVLGLILILFAKKEENHYIWKIRGSISLGNYIILSDKADEFTMKHEKGHQKQSLYLGWLYLFVIGIPSFLWAISRRLGFNKNKSYYWFYTESWANKLVMVYKSEEE